NTAGTIGGNRLLKGALLALLGEEAKFDSWSKDFLDRPIKEINSQHYVDCLRNKMLRVYSKIQDARYELIQGCSSRLCSTRSAITAATTRRSARRASSRCAACPGQ